MTGIIYLVALLSLTALSAIEANPLPKDGEADGSVEVKSELHAYTVSNETYSTIEQILEEVRAKERSHDSEPAHTINKRWDIKSD